MTGSGVDGVAEVAEQRGQCVAVREWEWGDWWLRIADGGADHVQCGFHGAEPVSAFAAGVVGLKLQSHEWSEEFPEFPGFRQIAFDGDQFVEATCGAGNGAGDTGDPAMRTVAESFEGGGVDPGVDGELSVGGLEQLALSIGFCVGHFDTSDGLFGEQLQQVICCQVD